MKKAIKAIFISIFTVCLNINYVTAVPFPAIEEFVTPDGPNKIYQVPNSKWCVPTCTDLASVYISRISGADPTDVSVQSGILVNGAVHRYLRTKQLDLEPQSMKAIYTGASMIPFIDCKPIIAREKMKLEGVFASADTGSFEDEDCEFLKDILYKQKTDKWQYNEKSGQLMCKYLELGCPISFINKDSENTVDITLHEFYHTLKEPQLQLLHFLKNAIVCLKKSLNLLGVETELNTWFQSKAITCKCNIIGNPSFNAILTAVDNNNLIILDFVAQGRDPHNSVHHACIVVGVTPPDTSERYLEVYNPDPTYGGPNPMIVDPSLSYRGRSIKTPVGIQKVVSRYMVIKYQREE